MTDLTCRKAKPQTAGYRVPDDGGLFLWVAPSGVKSWRWRYRVGGKEQTLTLGSYPDLSLAEAREGRDAARKTLKAGGDPAMAKRENRASAEREATETFEAVAREWHALRKPAWADHHAADVLDSLERFAFPEIGRIPIRRLTSPDVLRVVRAIEARPAIETARRVRQRISAVCSFAAATGRADGDPAAPIRTVMAPQRKGRQPAVTGLDAARDILRRVDETPASPVTKLALRMLALTALRPGTLVGTRWDELPNLGAPDPVWVVPSARMKLRLHHKEDAARDHLVPLVPQAIAIFEVLRPLTGRGPLVFPNSRDSHRPMSENAMGYLLNRAGYYGKQVPHGWRSTFSTVLNERLPADRAVIDLMLAHVPKEKVEAAYNRAAHMRRRGELARIWADLITEGLRPPEELLGMPRKGRD